MRHKSLTAPGGGTIALVLAVLLLSPDEALAYSPLEEGQVSLDRNPVLLPTAMPEELVCEYDEDDNGLDDEIESQIAQAFVPQFVFDAAEKHTRDNEPHAVFNTSLTLDGTGRRIMTIRYMFVWHEDGGFVNSDVCGDAHPGDTQPMTVTAELIEGWDRWYARLTMLDGFTQQEALGHDDLLFYGSHPQVFPGAGKHHFRPRAGEYTYDSTVDCHENALGNFFSRIPVVEHVPHGTFSQNVPWLDAVMAVDAEAICAQGVDSVEVPVCIDNVAISPATVINCGTTGTEEGGDLTTRYVSVYFDVNWEGCTDFPRWREVDGRRRWINVCTKRRTGAEVPATRSLRPLDLTDWGYPIDDYSPSFLTRYFRSHGVSGVYMNSPNTAEDIDGDGVSRWDDFCPVTPSLVPWTQLDNDGDRIGNECDPAWAFKSVYVAGGGVGYPAATASWSTSTQDFQGWQPVHRAGYLDSDSDGRPDGEDLCPFRAGSGGDTDRNQWGEATNWEPLEVVSSGTNDRLGTFYRGDTCDPYAHARPIWVSGTPSERWPSSSHCRMPGWRSAGASEVRIAHEAGQGISSNDPQKSWVNRPPTPYWTQTFRCACDSAVGVECVEDPSSSCFRNNVEPAAEHTALFRGRGWRAIDFPGCTESDRDPFGYCTPYSLPVPYGNGSISSAAVGNTPELLWTWLSELDRDQSNPAGDLHFASDDFTYDSPIDSPFIKHNGRYKSVHKYALWTWVGADDTYQAPGPFPASNLADPEQLDVRLLPANGANASEQSRRLRSGHDETPHALVSSYSVFDTVEACPAWTQEDIQHLSNVRWVYENIRCWPRPDEHVRVPSDMLLVQAGRRLDESYLVLGDARRLVSIGLLSDLTDWQGEGLTVPVTNVVESTVQSDMLDTAVAELAIMPHLMRLQQGVDAARWSLLRPAQFDGQTVSYGVLQRGSLPVQLTDASRLVQDELGTFVALIVPDQGVWGFEPKLERWIRAEVPEAAEAVLAQANAVLVGTSLFLTRRDSDAAWEGDTWQLDLFGRAPKALSLGLPVRSGARLALSTDRRALVLTGGVDAQGVHDDVWSVALPAGNDAWQPARRVRPDSGTASAASAATIVASDADGTNVRAWTFGAQAGAGTIAPLTRTERGWLQLDDEGFATVEACPEDDLPGGQLCALHSSWWASPGDKACTSSPNAGACEGTAGELVWERTLHVAGKLVDAANDGSTVWLLSQRELVRKQLGEAGQPVELARLRLPARGLSLAVSDGRVLVGLEDGVRMVEQQGAELMLSEAAVLCGRPLRIAPLAGPRWAVNTTLGTVLVNTGHSGAPTVESAVIVLPGPGGIGQTFDLPTAEPELAYCRVADRGLGALEALADLAALVRVSGDRLLVARGPYVVELDVSDATAPMAKGLVHVGAGMRWLRVDEAGGRAYGLGLGPAQHRMPVFNLRSDTLELLGQHDVPAWVSRQDAGRLSVIVQGGQVRVAEVLR